MSAKERDDCAAALLEEITDLRRQRKYREAEDIRRYAIELGLGF